MENNSSESGSCKICTCQVLIAARYHIIRETNSTVSARIVSRNSCKVSSISSVGHPDSIVGTPTASMSSISCSAASTIACVSLCRARRSGESCPPLLTSMVPCPEARSCFQISFSFCTHLVHSDLSSSRAASLDCISFCRLRQCPAMVVRGAVKEEQSVDDSGCSILEYRALVPDKNADAEAANALTVSSISSRVSCNAFKMLSCSSTDALTEAPECRGQLPIIADVTSP